MTKSRNSCQFSTTDQFVCLPGRQKKKNPPTQKQSKAKQKHRDKSGYQNWAQRQRRAQFPSRLISSGLVWSARLGSGLCPRLRLSPHIDNFSQALRRLHINTFFCRRFFKVCLFFRFFLFLFIFFFFFFSMSLTVKFSFPGWGTQHTHTALLNGLILVMYKAK